MSLPDPALSFTLLRFRFYGTSLLTYPPDTKLGYFLFELTSQLARVFVRECSTGEGPNKLNYIFMEKRLKYAKFAIAKQKALKLLIGLKVIIEPGNIFPD